MVIAPEQAAGEPGRVGHWTDIYSLGVIIYWMLAGRPPFEDKASGVLLAKHILDEPPPLQEVEPSVPQVLAGLVHQCLTKDPEGRPKSAAQIAEAFAIALGLDPQPLPGFRTRTGAPRSDTGDSRRLLPFESATTIGSETGEDQVGTDPSVVEADTIMGHSETVETPLGLPVQEITTGDASAGEVAGGSQTLMQIIQRGNGRWLALAVAAVALAAVAFVVWRPAPQQDEAPASVIPAREPSMAPDAGQPDLRRPTPDAAPPADSAVAGDTASKPDRARARSGKAGKGTGKGKGAGKGKGKGTGSGKPVPVGEPDNVGEGTLDPFGDVKPRKKN